jgi:riboflavin kinase/FMN adenylyltransferase
MNAPRPSIRSRTTTDQVVIVGVVEHGDRRGRTIGFPTANLRLDLDHAHIEDGVYAATVRLEDGRCVDSAVSIGRRPTFYPEGVRLCEAHLIDFDDDIYDTCITVTLVGRMRRQERFESVDELVVQLRADVAACTNLLRDR